MEENITSNTYLDYLKNSWKTFSDGGSFKDFWNKTLKSGGLFNEIANTSNISFNASGKYTVKVPEFNQEKLNLHITPSYRFYDGRSANKSWLQELPDLLTTAVWDSWVDPSDTPCRACVEAKLASEKYDVEIMVIAAK